MREFGRIVSDLNQGLDQVMGTIDRMQKLYRSFQDLMPIWQQLSGWLQRQEMATTSMSGPIRRAGPPRRRKAAHVRRRPGKARKRRKIIFYP
jgi:hypothetical protein